MGVIGYGTYGCIYKPPIKCQNGKDINYKNKVSKLLSENSAIKEYNEYRRIGKIDKAVRYHLGKPILCDPDIKDLATKTRKHTCKKYNANKDREPFMLLLTDYGGITLKAFCETQLSKKIVSSVFSQARNLFKGIELFLSHNAIHRDIKPANILINDKGKLVYIDFGLSEDVTEYKEKMLDDDGKHRKFHWSYPLEYGFYRNAKRYVNQSGDEVASLTKNLIYDILYDTTTDAYGHFESMFELLDNRLSPLTKSAKELMITDAIQSVVSFHPNHRAFLDKSIKTIDIFSLGLTMNYMLNAFFDNNLISKEFYRDMHELFMTMTDFNLTKRESSPTKLLNAYTHLLKKHKMTNMSTISLVRSRRHNKTKRISTPE
jgi:serine/threonine protein kinase